MTVRRFLVLTLGPVVIVGVLYRLTMTGRGNPLAAETATAAATPIGGGGRLLNGGPQRPGGNPAVIDQTCRTRGVELAPLLGANCRVLVRPPYVLAGDVSEEKLDRLHRALIVPIGRALSTCYFDRQPDEPVTILLFSTDAAYREHAGRLDGRRRDCYSGYYQRADRRIVLNIASGEGTLAHELTHALAHFDFPGMPEWFDEGLAALHEESEFSDDGLRLSGLVNWRLNHLLDAIRRGRLQPIEELMSAGTVRGGDEAVHYAQARYFCLYLQERRLLSHYYRKLRAGAGLDPTGVPTLRELLHTDSLAELDRDFRRWAQSLQPPR